MALPDALYHASPYQGLTVLQPRHSTHGQPWVYATEDKVMASVFLGREGGDFTCGTGKVGGKPYLVERFAGAFALRYGGKAASLYTVSAAEFASGKTSWSGDWVSTEATIPLHGERIPDAGAYLRQLHEDGTLTLAFYPERFCVPNDDSDLLERAVKRYLSARDPVVLEDIGRWHPGLMDRIYDALEQHDIHDYAKKP